MKKHTYIEDGKQKAETLVLDASNDVTITDAATGEVLTWNGSEWINTGIPEHDVDGGSF